MNISFLNILCCPDCRESFKLNNEKIELPNQKTDIILDNTIIINLDYY